MERRAFIAATIGLLAAPLAAEGQPPKEGIHRAFSVITRERAQALVVVADPLFGAHERRIVELAARNRLPAMHGLRQAATSGGLMSYGSNFDDLYRQAAIYVDKIVKGAKPGDLPVEQPTKFEQDRQSPRPDHSPVAPAQG
jgi:ABC-type uncharacterized transport system substrate-binding protein